MVDTGGETTTTSSRNALRYEYFHGHDQRSDNSSLYVIQEGLFYVFAMSSRSIGS